MANIEKLLYTIAEAQVALGISRSRLFILLRENLSNRARWDDGD